MLGIDNKTAVITGASQGLGKAMALELARFGAKVVIASRGAEAGEETASMIKKITPDCIYQKTDVTDYKQVDALISKTVDTFGGIDIMISNAGIFIGGPFQDIGRDDWLRLMDVNVNGLFYCGQTASREMIKAGKGGRIINVSSIIGLTGKLNCSTYAASKGAVNALTKNMAIELAPYNILVNAIVPGVFDSEVNAHIPEEERRKSMARIPLNRWGLPVEIAKSVVYLCSDLSTYVTGETLIVDGGYLAGKEITEAENTL
jgi:3-oxoacyl-[acyl-carrier protein] reductase